MIKEACEKEQFEEVFDNKLCKNEVVISIRNVSKTFCKNLKRSMLYGMFDLCANFFGIKQDTAYLRQDEFWACENIEFDVRKKEILGIIGPNGSGKSTLLRLITGIFPPDRGSILIRGKVGALIALGAGFHPHMTGLENIYLNGTILGMTRKELDYKIDNIIDLAEIGDFVDAPVSTYSSGMKVRLGFSIAVNIISDILLVDEVLSVGDAAFRQRTSNNLVKFKEKGGTIILISHNMVVMEKLCDRIIRIEKGRIVEIGEPVKIIQKYEESSMIKSRLSKLSDVSEQGTASSKIRIVAVRICDNLGCYKTDFQYKESFELHVEYEMDEKLDLPSFEISIKREGYGESAGTTLADNTCHISMFWDGISVNYIPPKGNVKCVIKEPQITPGNYGVYVGVLNSIGAVPLGRKWYAKSRKYCSFTILPGSLKEELPGAFARDLAELMPQLIVKHQWSINGKFLSTEKQ